MFFECAKENNGTRTWLEPVGWHFVANIFDSSRKGSLDDFSENSQAFLSVRWE